jgi:hypothetical protein
VAAAAVDDSSIAVISAASSTSSVVAATVHMSCRHLAGERRHVAGGRFQTRGEWEERDGERELKKEASTSSDLGAASLCTELAISTVRFAVCGSRRATRVCLVSFS